VKGSYLQSHSPKRLNVRENKWSTSLKSSKNQFRNSVKTTGRHLQRMNINKSYFCDEEHIMSLNCLHMIVHMKSNGGVTRDSSCILSTGSLLARIRGAIGTDFMELTLY